MTEQLAYTFRQAASALGFKDVKPIYRMYYSGEIKAAPLTLGGHLRISRDELERLLADKGLR